MIPKETLEDLYWNKNFTTNEIAKKFGIKHGRIILKKFKKYGIPSKTVSQALTRKFKKDFDGNPLENAYLLGLRAGDFHCRRNRLSLRVQTSTTHPALVNLMKESFGKYGLVLSYLYEDNAQKREWFIYSDLNSSFEFLLNKPRVMPAWILKEDNFFFSFFAAYMDCEGCWMISKSHKKFARFIFKLSSGDYDILLQLKEKLISLGYSPLLYISREKGTNSPYGKNNQDHYTLILNRKDEIITLVPFLLKYSRHDEKIIKMKFILNHRDSLWKDLESGWNEIREETKEGVLK